jgi:hypothetical protein
VNDYVRLRLNRGEAADNDASKLDGYVKENRKCKGSWTTLASDEVQNGRRKEERPEGGGGGKGEEKR